MIPYAAFCALEADMTHVIAGERLEMVQAVVTALGQCFGSGETERQVEKLIDAAFPIENLETPKPR